VVETGNCAFFCTKYVVNCGDSVVLVCILLVGNDDDRGELGGVDRFGVTEVSENVTFQALWDYFRFTRDSGTTKTLRPNRGLRITFAMSTYRFRNTSVAYC
jgi:hypothetical protein